MTSAFCLGLRGRLESESVSADGIRLTLSTVKNILGVDNVVKLTNLNIELRWGGGWRPSALAVEFRTL